MTAVAQIDPFLIRNRALSGKSTLTNEAIDLIIATINATIVALGAAFVLFDYTFTGTETSHFQVTIPGGIVMPDTNYRVLFGPQTEPDTFSYSADTFTTTTFMVRTSAQVPAGRKLALFVAEKTN